MTLPAASALLQQEAFSRLDGVVEREGGAFEAGRPLSHHTQLFQDTGCTFDMCLLTLPMMPAPLHLWLGPGCLLASQG